MPNKVHIVRAYYATYVMTSILSANTTELNPLLYGFEEEDERLHPDKAIRPIPEEYAVNCTCLKCATERCAYRKSDLPALLPVLQVPRYGRREGLL